MVRIDREGLILVNKRFLRRNPEKATTRIDARVHDRLLFAILHGMKIVNRHSAIQFVVQRKPNHEPIGGHSDVFGDEGEFITGLNVLDPIDGVRLYIHILSKLTDWNKRIVGPCPPKQDSADNHCGATCYSRYDSNPRAKKSP